MGQWIRKNLVTAITVIALIVGLSLLLYPSIANYWNSFHQSRAIANYNEAVDKMDEAEIERVLKNARKYNKELAETGMRWHMSKEQKAEYNCELKVDGTGVMAYISIPKFHVRAPIYHGTEENVLQRAIGHLEGSSLPVGGKSTHCLVSGHRGLPSARLFTDLEKMREGDTWTFSVLNETLTYEADQIRIVEPTDLSNLQIVEGEDLCTLITCTPYGINTHRLLIRGHRIPNADGTANLTADGIQIEPIYIAPVLAIPAIILLLIILIVSTRRARKFDPRANIQLYLEKKGLKK